MKKLQWTDKLSVGIAPVDAQHKQWIAHFNEAVAAVNAQLGNDHIIKNLSFLVDYTETHLAAEERYMTAAKYPGLAEHQAKHAELRATLADLVRDFEEEGASQPLGEAVQSFLGNWLTDHILEVDMKFGRFAREHGIRIAEEA